MAIVWTLTGVVIIGILVGFIAVSLTSVSVGVDYKLYGANASFTCCLLYSNPTQSHFQLMMLPYFVKVRLSLITGGRVRGFFVSHWNITDPLSPCSILMISPHWQLIFYCAPPPFPPPLYSVSDPICSPRKPCDPPKNRPTHRPTPPSTSFGIIIMLFVCFRSLLSTVLQNTIWDWEGTLDLTKVRDLYQL